MLRRFRFKVVLVIIIIAVLALYLKTWQNWSVSLKACCEEPVKECWACKKGETVDELYDSRRIKCCGQQTKICLACQEGLPVVDFCGKNPGKFGCSDSKPSCCKEQTKICLACSEGLSEVEFCERNPGKFGCSDSKLCCEEQNKKCFACSKGLSEDEFCAENPGKFDCPKPCCEGKRKECLACKKRVPVDEFCKQSPGKFGCPKHCCAEKNKECLACKGSMTVAEFCNKYQGSYGCHVGLHGDIMLGISLFNKKGYTQFTASVMRKHLNISQRDIYLFDDASTEYNESTLREWYGKDVRFFAGEENFGVGTTVRRILDHFVSTDYKVLFLIDGETIFLEEWEDFIQNHIHNATDGFLSLYHSSVNHNYTVDCENPVGDLCEGDAIGTMGVALTHSFAEILLKKHQGPIDNLNWTSILGAENIRSLYPLKSLTMQIGQTNQGEDNCGENKVGYRFNKCALPDWIKNGVQFYFDRCTRPNEFYFPDHSMENIEKEGRYWTRPAISYCFYGSRRRYTQIARENSARVFSIYPGWKIWIYTDGSVPEPIMKEICEFDVRFIDMSQTKIKSKMSWRFLVASEPVKMYAIRDIDSWLLPRGKAAVDEWIKSGRKFHVLRDHPNHSRYPMSGGMWGGTHDAIPSMKELLESRQMDNYYMTDMNFLNNVIWPVAKKSVWAHDSHSIHKFGEDHPFPTQQKGIQPFVGDVVISSGQANSRFLRIFHSDISEIVLSILVWAILSKST